MTIRHLRYGFRFIRNVFPVKSRSWTKKFPILSHPVIIKNLISIPKNLLNCLEVLVAFRIQPIFVEVLFIMRVSFRLNSVFGSTTKCMDSDPKNESVMVRVWTHKHCLEALTRNNEGRWRQKCDNWTIRYSSKSVLLTEKVWSFSYDKKKDFNLDNLNGQLVVEVPDVEHIGPETLPWGQGVHTYWRAHLLQ